MHLADLLLIFLAFVAGRTVQYKDSLYLAIFLIRMGIWMVNMFPQSERRVIEWHLKRALSRALNHKKPKLSHDRDMPGIG